MIFFPYFGSILAIQTNFGKSHKENFYHYQKPTREVRLCWYKIFTQLIMKKILHTPCPHPHPPPHISNCHENALTFQCTSMYYMLIYINIHMSSINLHIFITARRFFGQIYNVGLASLMISVIEKMSEVINDINYRAKVFRFQREIRTHNPWNYVPLLSQLSQNV